VARRSVWSDPGVQALAEKFLPVADEVGRLQRVKDPDGLYFQVMAEHGHYAGRTTPSDTRQGIYAFAPSGKFLASINTRSAEAVAGMLRKALKAWDALPAAERTASESQLGAETAGKVKRLERWYPKDGLVLRAAARDLPRERPQSRRADWRADAWNLDFAWFRKDEARSFVPEPTVGATAEVPTELASRFLRCHLIDNVRGQTESFPPKALERGALRTRVTAVEGEVVILRIEGEARLERQGSWPIQGFSKPQPDQRLGFEGRLLGTARWDRSRERFVQFELLAVGIRWGGTQFNGRGDDMGTAPIGYHFALAGDSPQERVAPARIWEYGWK
jgi:hypothetical protein